MANRYWVGWTGNWDASTTTNWSTSSGGGGWASVPTSADSVIFDTASSTANAAYTVTITATANCLDFTMDWPDPADATKVTWAGSSTLNIYWNMNLSWWTAWITRTWTWDLRFEATSGTKTISTNSVILSSSVIFNGSGGTFQLSDNFETSGGTQINRATGATFDANWKTVTLSNTSSINVINFSWTSSFYNLTRTGWANKTSSIAFSTATAITNTLTINWNSSTNRILVKTDTIWTTRTVTAATVTITNADFQDITWAGAGSWDLSAITWLSGDCWGNSGITFTTPTTTDCSAWTTWSTATWSSRVPLPQDTATFSGSSRTITQDMSRIGSVNFTGSSGLTWTTSTICSVFGSVNLTDLWTLTGSTQAYTFEWRWTNTLTSAGKSWSKPISLNANTWTLKLWSNFTNWATRNLTVSSGTFSAVDWWNNYVIDTGWIILENNTTTVLTLGSATHLIRNSWSIFNVQWTSVTITAFTWTIKFTNTGSAITFTGAWKTYNNVWFDRWTSTANITIAGSNTFNDFKDTWTAAHSILFTAWTTQTVTTFTVNGTVGNLITINSTTTATHALVKSGGGTISCDYLNIQHSVATPANTWYAWTTSTDNQAVATAGSGWIFTAPPASTSIKTFVWLLYASTKTKNWLAVSSIKSANWLQ